MNGLTISNNIFSAGTSSGTDTVVVTTTSGYSRITNNVIVFKAGGTNTGPATINVSGTGAVAIQKLGQALDAGDITLNDIVIVVDDGTQYQMISPARSPVVKNSSLLPIKTNTTQSNLASGTTTDLGTITSQNVMITGTTTITSFGSSANLASPIYLLEFNNTITLTYNGTSLIIPSSANITTAAGDTAVVEYLGSGNWAVREYYRKTGKALINPVFVGDSGSGGVAGLVPAPAAGDAAADKFLKADGTFSTIPSQIPVAGQIGSFAMAVKTSSSSTHQFGDTIAGTSLQPSSTNTSVGSVTTLTGTWQCVGFAANAINTTSATTLWLRIS